MLWVCLLQIIHTGSMSGNSCLYLLFLMHLGGRGLQPTSREGRALGVWLVLHGTVCTTLTNSCPPAPWSVPHKDCPDSSQCGLWQRTSLSLKPTM